MSGSSSLKPLNACDALADSSNFKPLNACASLVNCCPLLPNLAKTSAILTPILTPAINYNINSIKIYPITTRLSNKKLTYSEVYVDSEQLLRQSNSISDFIIELNDVLETMPNTVMFVTEEIIPQSYYTTPKDFTNTFT